MKAKIKTVVRDLNSNNPLITFEIIDKFDSIDYNKEDMLDLEFKKHREKRSLNANSYAWVLITQLSEKMNITKEEIYKNYIKSTNVYQDIEINKEATKTMIHSWSLHGIGWVAERLDNGFRDGFELIRLYYGSSTYNSKQMAKMIEEIVTDCKLQGIPVKEDKEIEEMLKQWQKV